MQIMFYCRITVMKSRTGYHMTMTCKLSGCFVLYPLTTKQCEDFLSLNTREKTLKCLLELKGIV